MGAHVTWGFLLLSTAAILASLHQSTLSATLNQRARQPRQNPAINVTSGVGCGTIRVAPNQVIQVNSSNFGIGNYNNKEACTWKFTATNDCALSVFCPCFRIPSSLGCLEDHLKIVHLHYQDKFCGTSMPVGVYRATSDFLSLRFKSDYRGTGRGFLCYVRCSVVGQADPVAANMTLPTSCPLNSTNPFGSSLF